MATITITHTRADGTIVHGTSRSDGSAEILKAAGFHWAPSLRAWIVQQSRDQAAKTWKIDRAAEGLRAAGFEVEVSINETPRLFAEAEAEREARADRYASRAERAEAASAAAAYQRSRDILDWIPPGQPIIVGHHSERGHRRDLERADNAMRQSIREGAKAAHYEHAAEVAGRYKQRRESLGTRLRRIARLEADQRDITRKLEGYQRRFRDGQGEVAFVETHAPATGQWAEQLRASLQQNADELTYWRRVVAEQEAAGAKVWSRADFAKGDRVLDDMGRWREVVRVNAKSLTVPTPYSWTETLPYDKVRGKRDGETR